MRNHNLILQERIKTLEDAVDDGRAERQLFETTMATYVTDSCSVLILFPVILDLNLSICSVS